MTHEDGHSWEAPGPPQEPGGGQGPAAPADPASPQTPWAAPGQHAPGPRHGWAAPGQGAPASPPPGYAAYGGPGPGSPDPRAGVVALRPLNLNEILNGAFSYIRHNPKAVLGLAVIVIAVFSIVSSIGMGGYLADHGTWLGQFIADPTAADPDVPIAPWTVIVMYGGLLFSYIGQIVLTGLLAAVVGLAVLGRKLTMQEAMEAVRGRMGAVFGVAGLLFLIGLGWTALLLGLLLVASAIGFFAGALPGVLVFLIGLVPLVALGVWVWVRTSLAMPVAILERIGAGRSLVRSWQLTQRSWWRVFGALLIAMVIASLVSNLLVTPFALGGLFVPLVDPGAPWVYVASAAASFLGTVLAGALTTPFIIGVTTLLYVDLRMRREGLDLKLRAAVYSGEAIGAGVYLPDPPSAPPYPGAQYAGTTPGNPM